jgi:hypothetical protein
MPTAGCRVQRCAERNALWGPEARQSDEAGMLLYLMMDSPAVGKTGAAVLLARSVGGVVIALDRIQVCPEMATGSGRPRPEEIWGVPHCYLAESRVRDGDWIGTLDGYRTLRRWCEDHGRRPEEPSAVAQACVRADLARAIARQFYERSLAQSPAFHQILSTVQARGPLTAHGTTIHAAA